MNVKSAVTLKSARKGESEMRVGSAGGMKVERPVSRMPGMSVPPPKAIAGRFSFWARQLQSALADAGVVNFLRSF